MQTGAVIVAAGMSSRMGKFKPMLKIGSISTIQRIILTLQQSGAAPIVVITGNQADVLEKHLAHSGVICLRNPDYANTQMFDSAKIGFRYLLDFCDRLLFTPVDIPLFTLRTVETLLASSTVVAIPTCGGKEGHPLLIGHEVLKRVLTYDGDGGLRGALNVCGFSPEYVSVEDEGILFDADTPQDYWKLLEWHHKQILHPQIRIELAREKPFLTPEVALLLRLIDNEESVRTACQQMNLSYSKGWMILNQIEKYLDFPVVSRHPGGAGGGHTILSQEGKDLLVRWEQMVREANQAATKIYSRIFEHSDL